MRYEEIWTEEQKNLINLIFNHIACMPVVEGMESDCIYCFDLEQARHDILNGYTELDKTCLENWNG